MLTRKEAEQELTKAAELNPGIWEQHCYSTAANASRIAKRCPLLDADRAYVMGLLHDVGRRAGVLAIRHIFEGYSYLMDIGQPELAKICLTHSFPEKNPKSYFGAYDCSEEEMKFLKGYLKEIEYDDYDRLIQLCDAISLPEGACIMEKRLVDVAMRYGFPESTLPKWRAFMEHKNYFDQLCGCDLYTFLPNVFENSCRSLI